MTSSSSPGISLMQEGLTYLAGAELPCLVIDVVRGGPGLGTIQPAQSDYFQATKGGGHGDYHLIVLAPASVQEMNDFVGLGFDLAFKYRNPAMILADGVIGQMMEKVQLSEYKPRWTQEEIDKMSDNWALTGKKAVQLCREKGIKVGILRPITLYPFPKKEIARLSKQVKGILTVEMSACQMVEDVRLNVANNIPVEHFGRFGGVIPTPEEIVEALEKQIIGA